MTEEWRPIPDWPAYEASDLGRIRSVTRKIVTKAGWTNTRRGRVLTPLIDTDGRQLMCFHRDGEKSYLRVHRLVLAAFVGPCPDGMQACHNDGDKTNNALSNLRWDTQSENMRDRTRHGVDPSANKTHCPQGHAYEGDNVDTSGSSRRTYRRCRTCHRARARERMRRLYWERKGQAA